MKRICIIQLLLFLIFISLSDSYNQQIFFRESHFALSRSKPLSTAGNGLFSYIPRLEPGLRLLKRPVLSHSSNPVPISTFSLMWLSDYEKPEEEVKENVIIAKIGKLFNEATNKVKEFSNMCVGYIKKVISATIIIASSLSLPSVKSMSITGNSILSAVAAAPASAYASTFKKYKNLSPNQKLATTPMYFLCNTRGNPYLQEDVQAGNPDQKIVVYFMSSEDANDYLNEMAQINNQNANEFRIMTTSMEKVMKQIQTHKQSRKIGRYDMDLIYRIQPSARQCENAEKLLTTGKTKKEEALQGISIPMFSCDGLGIQRANGEIISPYYFAYEDLVEDWNQVKTVSNVDEKKNKLPNVIVKDFTDVMCLSAGITTESLLQNNANQDKEKNSKTTTTTTTTNKVLQQQEKKQDLTPGIVPPRREIDMIKKYYRNEAGLKNEFSKSKLLTK